MNESKASCPKCGSKSLILLEVWKGHSITWEQIDGKFDVKDGSLEAGSAFRVEARCKDCKHTWKLRNANQIYDIIKD